MNSKDSIDSRKRRMAGPLDKAEGVYLYEQLPYESQNGYLGGSMIEWAFTTPASDRLRLQNSCIAVRYKIEKSDTKLSSATDYYYDSTLQASRFFRAVSIIFDNSEVFNDHSGNLSVISSVNLRSCSKEYRDKIIEDSHLVQSSLQVRPPPTGADEKDELTTVGQLSQDQVTEGEQIFTGPLISVPWLSGGRDIVSETLRQKPPENNRPFFFPRNTNVTIRLTLHEKLELMLSRRWEAKAFRVIGAKPPELTVAAGATQAQVAARTQERTNYDKTEVEDTVKITILEVTLLMERTVVKSEGGKKQKEDEKYYYDRTTVQKKDIPAKTQSVTNISSIPKHLGSLCIFTCFQHQLFVQSGSKRLMEQGKFLLMSNISKVIITLNGQEILFPRGLTLGKNYDGVIGAYKSIPFRSYFSWLKSKSLTSAETFDEYCPNVADEAGFSNIIILPTTHLRYQKNNLSVVVEFSGVNLSGGGGYLCYSYSEQKCISKEREVWMEKDVNK